MKKKMFSALLCAVMLTAAGCGDSAAGGAGASDPGQDTQQTAQEESGGEDSISDSAGGRDSVVVADWLECSGFQPDASMLNMCVQTNMYDPLWLAYDEEKFEYRIAQERVWEDETHCRITLRDDVRDHAGNPITASDVLFSLKLAKESGGATAASTSFIDIDGCVIENDFEFVMVMTNGTALNDYNISAIPILSQKAYEESPDGMVLTPVGTGPYKLADFVSGSHVDLEYFEDYYRLEEAPQIKHVRVMFATDSNQRTNVVLAGEADIAIQTAFTDLAEVESNPGLTTYFGESTNQFALLYNDGPESVFYKNPELRKAIAYAIDNAAFSAVSTMGNAPVAQAMGCSDAPDMTQESLDVVKDTGYYAYDMDKARECVAQANVPAGTVIKMSYGYTAGHDRLAEMIQASCQEIGLTVELEFQPDWLSNLFGNPTAYDMTIISWEANPNILTYTRFGNIWHFDDEEYAEFNTLYEQAMFDASGTNQYMDELQKWFYDNCYSYGIYDDAGFHAVNKDLNIVMRTAMIPEYCEWTYN